MSEAIVQEMAQHTRDLARGAFNLDESVAHATAMRPVVGGPREEYALCGVKVDRVRSVYGSDGKPLPLCPKCDAVMMELEAIYSPGAAR